MTENIKISESSEIESIENFQKLLEIQEQYIESLEDWSGGAPEEMNQEEYKGYEASIKSSKNILENLTQFLLSNESLKDEAIRLLKLQEKLKRIGTDIASFKKILKKNNSL